MITIQDIYQAQERIAPYIQATPLLRAAALDQALGCRVYLKAECMQTTGAFKLRGAMNRLLSIPAADRAGGVVAASSGNHGRAVAHGARLLGCPAVIVIPRTAPKVKVEAIRALGAEVVQCDAAQRFQVAEDLCRQRGGTLVPPYNDELVMAGQGTLGLELLAQEPELDAVVTPVSGGGLLGGVATAVKALSPAVRVYGAEPAALPRYSRSLEAGHPVTVPQATTVADALVSQTPGSLCFPAVAAHADGVYPVEESAILQAMGLLLTQAKLLAEPAACTTLAAALTRTLPLPPETRTCFVLSGGNVGMDQVREFGAGW